MLKVFFPGGDELLAPGLFEPIEGSPKLNLRSGNGEPIDTSIRLVSRIFSMMSIEEVGINLNNKDLSKIHSLPLIDFDIAQFCNLMERFKFTWRTAFQIILFRAFMQGRSHITNCQRVIQKLGFRKHESSGLSGLIIKAILVRKSLGKEGNSPSFWEQFAFLSKTEVSNLVKKGAELWVTLKKIHTTAALRSTKNDQHVKVQFEQAHNFLVNKIQEHNGRENNLFREAMDILRGDSAPGADGLSSQ